MKAYFRPQRPITRQQKQMRQRVKMDVDRYIDAKKKTMSDRICAIVCITLNSEFDFGPVRLQRFWDAFQKEIARQILNMDDTQDDLLFGDLRRIGMGHLNEVIQEDYKAEKETMKGSIFDTGGTDDEL